MLRRAGDYVGRQAQQPISAEAGSNPVMSENDLVRAHTATAGETKMALHWTTVHMTQVRLRVGAWCVR
jgi:hypothetical protein